MGSTKEEAQQKIAELVARFQALPPAQLRSYHEANTKSDFVEPLFAALGWNRSDSNEVAREERASGGRVDYAFKIRGVSRFYVEAKPLRDDLNNPEWVKQAITYAYNKGVSWAVLTNFRDLQVFNAHWETRDLARARAVNLSCQDYLTDFDRLWLFSKEAVAFDALDKEATKWGMPPRLPVEKRLFGQLRQWRAGLYTHLYRYEHDNHLKLSFEQIDETILRLFNRLIFIRNAEDRRLEERRLLAAIHEWRASGRRDTLLERLRQVFRTYDGYYDSDLFTLHLADQTFVQDDLLEEMIGGLYDLPGGLASYDFSILDADVLGAVYEQYLGHVAAEVKEKVKQQQSQLALGIMPAEPVFEVTAKKQKRKERGIYYTPRWVVDYIVRETVGRMLRELPYSQARQLRVLDPACGSGSFLIRAYDELLRWYAQTTIPKSVDALEWQDRISILTRHIYGVDLDPQAVEIARLSVLLQALAGRNTLPVLRDNIKRGNSLISGRETELTPFFGDAWQGKHPFNWEQEFPDVLRQGGFDVVIGNPPYVRIQSQDRAEADYYWDNYDSAYGSFDISVVFLEKGIKLLRPQGRLGFITSGKFLKSKYGENIQRIVRQSCVVESMVDLSQHQVFPEATNYPVVMVLRKGQADERLRYTFLGSLPDRPVLPADLQPEVLAPQDALTGGMWPLPTGKAQALLDKVRAQSVPLGEVSSRIFQGLITSADKVYILEKRRDVGGGLVRVYSRAKDREYELEAGLLHPLLSGKDVTAYVAPTPNHLLLFPYKVSQSTATLLTPEKLAATYPNCWRYLLDNRRTLEDREGGKMHHEGWYAYVYPKNLVLHDLPKLAIPRLVHRLEAIYDRKGEFYLDNVDVGGLLLKEQDEASYLFILGLLNSHLLDFYFRHVSAPFRGGFRSANRQFLEPLPIRRIDLTDSTDRQMRDGLVALVERMLELHKRLAQKGDIRDLERQDLEREIERTDHEIDQLVYDLYGLTAEERQLVEAEMQRPTK
ncbi:MAG: N-6 DNA methylase [Chloroflexi bacterium]|nr:N-6 DNA methylase [Chloroflexota bacterium]